MNWNYNYNFIESIGGEGLIKDHLVVNLNYQNTNGSGSWFDASGNGNTFSISGSLVNSGSLGWAFDGLGFQSVYFTGSYLKINGNEDAFADYQTGFTVMALVYPEDNTDQYGSNQILMGNNNMDALFTPGGRGTPWFYGFNFNPATASVSAMTSKEGFITGSQIQNFSYTNNVANNYYPIAVNQSALFTIASKFNLSSAKYFQENLVANDLYNPLVFNPGNINGGWLTYAGNGLKFGWVDSSNINVDRTILLQADYHPFKGTLRNLLIYNKQLSGAEVQKNYLMFKKGYLI